MEVKLALVRLGPFAALFEPKSFEGSDPRYNAALIIDPKSENAKKMKAAVEAVAKEKWKDKAPVVLKKLREDGKISYYEREATDKEGNVRAGFEDMYYASAGSNPKYDPKPIIKDENDVKLVDMAEGKPYPGCFIHAVVDVWAQDNKWGRRINVKLLGVKFKDHGEAFMGGTRLSEGAFEDLDAGEQELA